MTKLPPRDISPITRDGCTGYVISVEKAKAVGSEGTIAMPTRAVQMPAITMFPGGIMTENRADMTADEMHIARRLFTYYWCLAFNHERNLP